MLVWLKVTKSSDCRWTIAVQHIKSTAGSIWILFLFTWMPVCRFWRVLTWSDFFIFALVTATPSSDFCIFSPTSSAWSQLAMSSSAAAGPLDTDVNDDISSLNGLCWSTHSRSFTISFVSCVDLDVLDTSKMVAICKPGHRFMYSSTMMHSTNPLVPYALTLWTLTMHESIILNSWKHTLFKQLKVLEGTFPWKYLTNTWHLFSFFSPYPSHPYPLQVENYDSNSRLVLDEGDNVKSGLKGISHATASRKPPWNFIDHMRTCSMHRLVHKPPQYFVLHDDCQNSFGVTLDVFQTTLSFNGCTICHFWHNLYNLKQLI